MVLLDVYSVIFVYCVFISTNLPFYSNIFLCCNLKGDHVLCRYTDDMELDDAVHTAILTLKEGYIYNFFQNFPLFCILNMYSCTKGGTTFDIKCLKNIFSGFSINVTCAGILPHKWRIE